MPRFSKEQKAKRIEDAKRLYCKGFDFNAIGDILRDVSPQTVKKWATENDFETARRSQLIALSQIRNTILESYVDMLDGKKPKMGADAAAKYATAFEKFSSKKKVLMYMYEAFELLTAHYEAEIAEAKTKQSKQQILNELVNMRGRMDKVITTLNNEVLNG